MTLEKHKPLVLGVLLLASALFLGRTALTPTALTPTAPAPETPSASTVDPDGEEGQLDPGIQTDSDERTAYGFGLEVDENKEAAPEPQVRITYDGKSFETYAALSKYRRAEAQRKRYQQGFRSGARIMPLVHDGYHELHPGDAGLWEE